jgi:hypothetical protein
MIEASVAFSVLIHRTTEKPTPAAMIATAEGDSAVPSARLEGRGI